MKIQDNNAKCLVVSSPDGALTLRWDIEGLRLDIGNALFLVIPLVGPQPCIKGLLASAPVRHKIILKDDAVVITWNHSLSSGPIERCWGEILFSPAGLRFKTSYIARNAHILGGWDILPNGSQCTMDVVKNLWNSPGESDNFLTLPLNKQGDTTTAGANRIWAPHVSAIQFASAGLDLLLGVPALSPAFGLHFQNDSTGYCQVKLDYGGEYGLEVQAGERIDSPPLLWRVTHGKSSQDAMADFFTVFERDDIQSACLADHWRKPWYCTWADQYSINKNCDGNTYGRHNILDEDFVLRAADCIATEQLPVGTIIIDEGWQTFRGDWNIDRRKFPDFRKLVDDLHARGLLVMLWWAPLCFDAHADMAISDWMFCDGLDTYGERRLDYSNPRVQHEYLAPLMRQFFSSDSDCWNIDGIKMDFLADRNHPGARVTNIEWHGQERYLLNFYRLVWELAHQHKDDVCIYGTAQHPSFSPYQNVMGLEETYTPDCDWIPSRGELQSSLMPKMAVTAHFNYFCRSAEPFMKYCQESGIIPQIPPLFEDLEGYHPDRSYFSMLKRSMSYNN